MDVQHIQSRLTLDTSDYTRNLAAADSQMEQFGRQIAESHKSTLSFTGGLHGATGVLGNAASSFGKTALAGGSFTSAIQGSFNALSALPGPLGVAASGLSALTGFLSSAAKEAIEGEASTARFTRTMTNAVPGWQAYSAQIEASTRANERLGVSDDKTEASLGRLVASTKNVTEGLHLQRIAMDVVAEKGGNLAAVSDTLARIHDGQVGAARRLGVVLGENATVTEALAAVQARYAGASEAQSKTTQGAMARLSVTFDEVKERIGRALLPAINAVLTGLADMMPTVMKVADVVGGVLGPVFEGIGWTLEKIGTTVRWFTDIVGSLFGWLETEAPKAGDAAGGGFIRGMSGSLAAGMPGVQGHLSDLNASLGSIDGLGLGSTLGSGYTGGVEQAVYDGLPGVDTQVGNVAGSLGSVDGLGIGRPIGHNYMAGIVSAANAQIPQLDKTIAAIRAKLALIRSNQFGDVKITIPPYGPPSPGKLDLSKYGVQPDGSIRRTPGVTPAEKALNDALSNAERAKAAAATVSARANVDDLFGRAAAAIDEKTSAIYTGAPGTINPIGRPDIKAPAKPPGGGARGGGGGGSKGGGAGSGPAESARAAAKSALEVVADITRQTEQIITSHVASIANLAGFRLPQNFESQVDLLAGSINTVLQKFQAVAVKYKAELLQHTSLFLDTSKKATDLVGGGAKALQELQTFQAPSGIAVQGFVDSVQDLVKRLGVASRAWSVEALAELQFYSESVGKAVSMVGGATKTLQDLKDFVAPSEMAVLSFVSSLDNLIAVLSPRLASWYDKLDKVKVEVAQHVGNAVSGVGKALEPLQKMAAPDFTMPSLQAVQSFFDSLDRVVPMMDERTRGWYGHVSKESAELAGWIGQSISGILGAVEPLTTLAKPDITFGPRNAVTAFFDGLDLVVEQLRTRNSMWYGQMSKGASETAGYVGSAVSGVLASIEPLMRLASPDVIMPGLASVGRFFDSLDLVTAELDKRNSDWYGRVSEGSAKTAGYVGDAVSGLMRAVEPLTNLSTFKAADTKLVRAFFSSLDLVLVELDLQAASFSERASVVSVDLAHRIGTLTEGIGKAVQPLMDILAFKLPVSESVGSVSVLGHSIGLSTLNTGIDAFFDNLDYLFGQFDKRAAQFQERAGVAAADLAVRMGTIGESIGKALDPLLKVVEAQKVDRSAIEGSMANLHYLLYQFEEVRKGLPASWAADATAFAGDITQVFGAINGAVDAASAIGGKQVDSAAVTGLFAGMGAAIRDFLSGPIAAWKAEFALDVETSFAGMFVRLWDYDKHPGTALAKLHNTSLDAMSRGVNFHLPAQDRGWKQWSGNVVSYIDQVIGAIARLNTAVGTMPVPVGGGSGDGGTGGGGGGGGGTGGGGGGHKLLGTTPAYQFSYVPSSGPMSPAAQRDLPAPNVTVVLEGEADMHRWKVKERSYDNLRHGAVKVGTKT